MNPPKQPPDEPSICIGCGFCCNGTLHTRTTLEPGDVADASVAGLTVVENEGKPVFFQPCPKFESGACTIYAKRPGVCRRYRCKLLNNVDEGLVSVTEARETIATAKTLIEAVRVCAPEAVTAYDRSVLRENLKGDLGQMKDAESEQAARILLDIGALDYFLERSFNPSNTAPSDRAPKS
jgi:uncharacterized protein